MNVNHIRPPRQIARQMHHAFGEKNVTLGVVGMADVVFLINPGPVKKAGLIYEIKLQPGFQIQFVQFRLNVL